MAWTEENIETLRLRWAEGQSASHIARELGGMSRNAVIGKVYRLGLSERRERVAEIRVRNKSRRNKSTFSGFQIIPRTHSKPPTPIQPTLVPIDPLYISLIDLESYQCRWPLDHKGQDGLETFCGHTKFGEYSYCYAHCCVGYRKFACGPGEVLEAAE